MADGGVYVKLSDEKRASLDYKEHWYRVYPPYEKSWEDTFTKSTLPGKELITGYTATKTHTNDGTVSISGGTLRVDNVVGVRIDNCFTEDFIVYEIHMTELERYNPGGTYYGQHHFRLSDNGNVDSSANYNYAHYRMDETQTVFPFRVATDKVTLDTQGTFTRIRNTAQNNPGAVILRVSAPAQPHDTAYECFGSRGGNEYTLNVYAGNHVVHKSFDGIEFQTDLISKHPWSANISIYGVA